MNPNANGLHRAFNPRTVAVVGDKKQTDYMWLRNMKGFRGKLYSVQVDPQELAGIAALGVSNCPSLKDIPEAVDYVLCAVPRAVAPRIVADCIEKKVGGVALFTSGFAETGTEEGARLQGVLTEMARKSGLTLIGPNCMGIYNPSLGLCNGADQPVGAGGPVGFISQSGNHGVTFSLVAARHGLRVSKLVSFGNAVVLDSPDYLEYLAQDANTRAIGMYLEGVKDGRRFLRTLKSVAAQKPVVIWKGGQTEAGARASASHTASLAASHQVWLALVRQGGALAVDSLEEMVDTLKALLFLKPPSGGRVGLVAATGGQSVVMTDAFTKAGLEVPLLTEATYKEFAGFFNIVGGSYKNPLDVSSNFTTVELVRRILTILEADAHVDALGVELSAGFLTRRWQRDPQFAERYLAFLEELKGRSPKPLLVIGTAGHKEEAAVELREKLAERGIPAFPTFERAARALKRALDYHRSRAGL
ncbi:MAG: CoA-binding protein [Chloroflexi bacterium]|nr:CoA-binding protein [Chloroflexota bacterium]